MHTKICSTCELPKFLSEFYHKRSNCKNCQKLQVKKYRKNPTNKRNISFHRNKEKDKISKQRWERNNRLKRLEANNKWRKTANYKQWWHNKYHNNPLFAISQKIRSRMSAAIRSQRSHKANHSLKLIGCSFQELKLHLESLFTPGMTWENYGRYGWHVDHILPCASFDLSKPEEQKKCFHFTNLQPLWARDNLVKGCK